MALEEDLSLDVGPAEQAIDRLGKLLDQQAKLFASALGEAVEVLAGIPISVDTSDVAGEIAAAVDSADAVVEVQADTADAEAEIDSVPDGEAAIEVSADTEGAQAAVADLTAEVQDLGGAGGLAADSTEGLGEAAEGLDTSAVLAAVSVAALVAATKELFTGALEAESSTQAFNLRLGESAAAVESLDVLGLNEDLDSLVQRLGSSDEAVRNAAARLFTLGESSGAAASEVEATTQQVIGLALRATALDPTLGDAGTAVEGLTSGLARGGRALTRYGLAITAADIEARALADTGKGAATELTVYEKAAAGAALATEQLGDSLATDINAGAENSGIQLRRLRETFGNLLEAVGQPLIAPVLDALEQGIEPGTELAEVLAEIAVQILPILTSGMIGLTPTVAALANVVTALAPVLGVVADLLASIPSELVTTIATVALLSRGLRVAQAGFDALSLASGRSRVALSAANPVFLIATVTIGALVTAIGENAQAERERKQAIDQTADALRGAEDATEAYAEIIGELLTGTDSLSKKLREAGVTQSELTAATLDNEAAGRILQRMQEQGIDLSIDEVAAYSSLIETQREGAQAAFEGALATEEFGKRQADAAIRLATTEQGVVDYAAALDFARDASEKATGAGEAFTGVLKETGAAAVVNEEGVKAARDSIDSWIKAIQDGLPAVTDALQDLNENGRVSIQEFTKSLEEQTKQIAEFPATINTLFALGFEDLAGFLQTQGPEMTAQFAEDIRNGGPEVAAAADAAIRGNVEGAVAATDALVKGPAGSVIKGDFDYLGQQAILGLEAGTGPLPAKIGTAVQEAAAAFARETGAAAPGIEADGFFLGDALGGGVSRGLRAKAREVAQEAINVVIQAITSARQAADANSPSRVFALLGEDMGDGIALGLNAATRGVVAEAEAILAAAAGANSPAFAGVGAAGGGGGVTIGQISLAVSVTGAVTPEQASSIGAAVGTAAVEKLEALALLDVDFDSRIA